MARKDHSRVCQVLRENQIWFGQKTKTQYTSRSLTELKHQELQNDSSKTEGCLDFG